MSFEDPLNEIIEVTEGTVITYLPIVCLLVFNSGILLAVYRSSHTKSLSKSTSTSQDSSVTSATILLTTTYLIFQIQASSVTLFWTSWDGAVTPTVQQWQRLSNTCAIVFENMGYCLNSYLYMLACGRIRQELFNMILCRPR